MNPADKSSHLLLISDLSVLRAKLACPRAPLDRYWRNYLDLAAADPIGEFQALPPLAWLMTGQDVYARNTRSVFLELIETLPLADASLEAQFHAYTMGAPVARFAIFLDWIWESNILSETEKHELAGRMVSQVYSHCYLRLKGRLPAGDNQQGSMAFACAVVGYLFGMKRTASPAAQRMFKTGISRYTAVLKYLGPGGWSGEGSTYQHQVLAPILALYTAFMEQVTGQDWFNRALGAATVRAALELSAATINTAGMLPGWDDYGICAPELKTYLAYLARKTGQAAPLAEIVRHGMWTENEILGWYNDDKVWTLVFWPDNQPDLSTVEPSRSWLNRPVGGKLTADNGTIDLLQMWDVTEPGRPGRAHINPNSVELCSYGAVHTSDGHGAGTDRAFFDEPDGHSFAAAHSVVIVDGDGYRFLDHEFMGCGDGLVDLPSLKAVRGDVTGYYRSLWGLRSMHRSSLLIGDRLVLVHDRFESDTPHHYTWQLMLRPNVTVDGNRARQRLREGTVLDIAACRGSTFHVATIREFPRVFEQLTHRLSLDKRCDGNGSIAVVMRPQAGRSVVRDISRSWSVITGGAAVPAALFDAPVSVDLSSEYLGGPVQYGTLWFGQVLTLSEHEATRCERLSIRRGQVDRLEVFVNDVRAMELFENPSIIPGCHANQKPDGRFWESHFDLTGLLKEGSNRIAIASSEFRGQTITGPIQLIQIDPPDDVALDLRDEGDWLEIVDGDTRWTVVPDNRTRKEHKLPGGVTTNAERAVLTETVLALGGVTACVTPSFSLTVNVPINLELADDILTVDPGHHDRFRVQVTIKDETFEITPAGVTGSSEFPWQLRLHNTGGADLRHGSRGRSPSKATDFVEPWRASVPASRNASLPPLSATLCAYDAGFLDDTDPLQAIQADDWRTQVAAVDRIGEQGRREAIPDLIALFEREEQCDLYPEIKANWPFAKMKTTFYRWATLDDLPAAGMRRYRLKLVILQALGRLGAAESESLVIRTLDSDCDFYPVMVHACLAAARLRLRTALPALDNLKTYLEKNTRLTSILAARLIRNEISEQEFNNAI